MWAQKAILQKLPAHPDLSRLMAVAQLASAPPTLCAVVMRDADS